MAEIIDLMEIINKRKEKEVNDLAQKLADIIEDLGVENDFQMYVEDLSEGFVDTPFIYTITAPYYSDPNQVTTLSDITDVLTKITLQLDMMGYNEWANQISGVVGEMFVSGTFKEG